LVLMVDTVTVGPVGAGIHIDVTSVFNKFASCIKFTQKSQSRRTITGECFRIRRWGDSAVQGKVVRSCDAVSLFNVSFTKSYLCLYHSNRRRSVDLKRRRIHVE
jgi:hypothetical protein